MGKVVPLKKSGLSEEEKHRIQVIDELGALQAQLAAMKPAQKRVELLTKEVRGWADRYPASQPVLFEGQAYAVEVSARTTRRRIVSMAKLFAALGQKKFLELCGFTLKAAEENLTPAQRAKLIAEDQYAGERTVKTMQRAVPANAA